MGICVCVCVCQAKPPPSPAAAPPEKPVFSGAGGGGGGVGGRTGPEDNQLTILSLSLVSPTLQCGDCDSVCVFPLRL